jgi:hypothetical protein
MESTAFAVVLFIVVFSFLSWLVTPVTTKVKGKSEVEVSAGLTEELITPHEQVAAEVWDNHSSASYLDTEVTQDLAELLSLNEEKKEPTSYDEKVITKSVKKLRAAQARQIADELHIDGKVNGKKRDISAVKEDIISRWIEAPEVVSQLVEKVVSTSLQQTA